MRKTTKRSFISAKVEPVTKYEFDTFRGFNSWEERQLSQESPSCLNGTVRFRKWRISAEIVDEPVEVLAERIQSLWDYSNNYHDTEPLRQAAASIGYELKNERGNKRNL